jgi:hypothetical protein
MNSLQENTSGRPSSAVSGEGCEWPIAATGQTASGDAAA